MQGDSAKGLILALLIVAAFLGIGYYSGSMIKEKLPAPLRRGIVQRSIPKQPAKRSVPHSRVGTPDKTPSQKGERNLFGYPPTCVDAAEIMNLFRQKRFADLNQNLESYQTKFEQDFHYENDAYDGFLSFSVEDPALEPVFQEWIDKTPNTFVPYLARAEFYDSLAWKSRGTKWANETSREQFAMMDHYFDLAVRDSRKALEFRKDLLIAYNILMGQARAHGEDEVEDRLAAEILQRRPESFRMRRYYMFSLEPRWGGSYEAMEEFAAESEKLIPVNPKLVLLRGYIDLDKSDSLQSDDKYEQALAYYNHAVSLGESVTFLYERGMNYIYMNRFDQALADFDHALEICPNNLDARLGRAEVLSQLNRMPEALQDYQIAMKWAPEHSSVNRSRRRAARNSIVKGYDFAKRGNYPQALALFNDAVQLAPRFNEGYHYRGFVHIQMRSYDLARQDLDRSIQLDPHYFDSYRLIDWVIMQNRGYDEVISYWNRYLALEPSDGRAYWERAGTYHHKGDEKAAAMDGRKACELGNQEACARYPRLK